MPITARTDKKDFPGCLAEVTSPFTCTNYPTFQELAREVQEGLIVGTGGTIVSGRLMTNALKEQLETACEAV